MCTGLFDLPLCSRVCQLVKSFSLRFLMLDDVLNFERCRAQKECNISIANDNPYYSKSNEEIDSPIMAKVSYLCDEHEKGRLPSDIDKGHHDPHTDRTRRIFVRHFTSRLLCFYRSLFPS